MQKAIVTTQGPHQLVQLPEGFQVSAKELYVKRLGKSFLLIPDDADAWDLMEESLDLFTDDFMADRCQPGEQQREDPFT